MAKKQQVQDSYGFGPGTVLTVRTRKTDFPVDVVLTDDGLRYTHGGKAYATLSAAVRAICGWSPDLKRTVVQLMKTPTKQPTSAKTAPGNAGDSPNKARGGPKSKAKSTPKVKQPAAAPKAKEEMAAA